MKSVSVFCGSSFGNDPAFKLAAQELGAELAKKNVTLVYGGAQVGLMGTVADAVLDNGGKAIGVLPTLLNTKEIAHPRLTEFIACETMHERKMKMFERSEGFIALPGGFGTLEEVVEILTWGQLGLHRYPIAFLNVKGYYDHLKVMFEQMAKAELLKQEHLSTALFADNVTDLLKKMESYVPPALPKWIKDTNET
jgi:uncharacterized protein (TIGR00730 family)